MVTGCLLGKLPSTNEKTCQPYILLQHFWNFRFAHNMKRDYVFVSLQKIKWSNKLSNEISHWYISDFRNNIVIFFLSKVNNC